MTKDKRFLECAYCGREATTRDHIPPKCLFSSPRPNDLITVPSCLKHNLEASKDDEYLKWVLAIRHDIGDHPNVKKLWPGIMRGLNSPRRARLKKSLLSSIQEVELFTPAGIYLGNSGTFNVDLTRLDSVVERIISGLFYHINSRRINDAYKIAVYSNDGLRLLNAAGQKQLKEYVDFALTGTKITLGDDVFSYWLQSLEDDPDSGVAVISFYLKVHFIGLIFPQH